MSRSRQPPPDDDDLRRVIDDHSAEDARRFDGLESILKGDGHERLGVIGRLDRLEVSASAQRRLGNMLLTTLVGLVATGVGTVVWAAIKLVALKGP